MSELRMLVLGLLLAVAGLSGHAQAADEAVKDRVSFQVEAGSDIENDRLLAVLVATAEDQAPAKLADTINSAMQWALDEARSAAGVKVRSGSYQIHPVYDDRKIVNWRGRQEMYLESQDTRQITALIGVLQARLQMQSMQFSVSPERRIQAEEGLIQQALAAFQKRAGIISGSLGAKGYRLRDVSIHSGGHDPRPLHADAMVQRARVSAPAVESGTSRVTVQVSGSIQLQR